MDELDSAPQDDSLLSVVSGFDFEPNFCSMEPDVIFPAFQTSWDPYEDDLFDDLLSASIEANVKAPAAIKDHDYVSSQPKSPSSDSGHSSASRSPFTSSASEDTPPPTSAAADVSGDGLDDDGGGGELFRAFEVAQFNEDGTPAAAGSMAPGQAPEDFSIDLDLELSDLEPEVAAGIQDMCLLMPMNVVLPFTVQQAKVMAATASCPADLRLTDEEKELLSKEGVSLPTNMPLTKSEERILRSVRRRIRNKQSARNSRKKKQDYMDNLEERVKMCSDEKKELEKKVTVLEKQNMFLMGQLRRLQSALRIDSTKPAKTTTCALVLVLSFALFIMPSLSPFSTLQWGSPAVKSHPMAGRSRNLLEVEDADRSTLVESVWEARVYVQDAVSRYSSHGGTWLAWLISSAAAGGKVAAAELSSDVSLGAAKANLSAMLDDDGAPAAATLATDVAGVPRSIIVTGAASDVARHDDF